MFNFRKKEKIELQSAKNDLKDNERILNEIHHYLFAGEELNLEIIDELMINLQIVDEGLKEYYAKINDSLKGKLKVLVNTSRKYAFEDLLIILLSIVMGLFLKLYSFPLIFVIVSLKACKDKVDEKLAVSIKEVNGLFKAMNGRIKNYKNVVEIKYNRLRTVDESSAREDDDIIIANQYLEMYLDDRIFLDDIPLNIQSVLLMMLQNELGEGTLEKLLTLVKNRKNENMIERRRKM